MEQLSEGTIKKINSMKVNAYGKNYAVATLLNVLVGDLLEEDLEEHMEDLAQTLAQYEMLDGKEIK